MNVMDEVDGCEEDVEGLLVGTMKWMRHIQHMGNPSRQNLTGDKQLQLKLGDQ